MKSSTLAAAGAIFMVAMIGCSRQKHLETELVEGVVTLDGQPVPDATVTFVPVQEGAGVIATGMTDSTGKYTLTAVGSGAKGEGEAGTLPGDYYVGVIKDQLPQVPQSVTDPGYAKSSEHPIRPEDPPVTHVVPERFNAPETSGIKVTVKGGKNEIPLDLKSK